MRATNLRRYRRRSRPFLEALEPRNLLSAVGSLDPSFGGGLGFVSFPVSTTTDQATFNSATVTGVVAQPDGKILVAGTVVLGNGDERQPAAGLTTFVVERLNADGTPDQTFGTNGVFTVNVSYDGLGHASTILLQPNGDVILTGSADLYFGGPSNGGESFVAIRLLPGGKFDPSFGAGGLVSYPAGSFTTAGHLNSVNAAALQTNGDLVMVGTASTSQYVMAAVRLTPDGALDTTFGTTGTVDVPVTVGGSAASAYGEGVVIQSSGQIVIAGATGDDVVAVRLDSDGTLDDTFGVPSTGGQVIIPPASGAVSGASVSIPGVAQQFNGEIIISMNNYQFTTQGETTIPSLVVLAPDGGIDTAFGQSGYLALPIGGPVAVQPDGDIVVAGALSIPAIDPNVPNRTLFASLRLTSDGSPNATYGNTSTPGLAVDSFGAGRYFSSATAVAIDPTTNNVVLAGTSSTSPASGVIPPFAVARTLNAASTGASVTPSASTPPASFDGSGLTNLAVYLPASGSFAFRPENGTADVNVQFGIPGAGQTIPAAADYAGVGQTQIAAYLSVGGVYAVAAVPGVSPARAITFGIPGIGQSIPTPGDYEGTGKDDIAIYMPAIGTFAVISSDGAPAYADQFGQPGAGNTIPAPADYFGTGRDDIAVYMAQAGSFSILNPAGGVVNVHLGLPGVGVSTPAPGDYSGSGHAELAVYISALGEYAYWPAGGAPAFVKIGTPGAGDLPAPGDYDGVGHDEFAVYDPATRSFIYQPASGGPEVTVPFGTPGVGLSIPVTTAMGALPQFTSMGTGSGGGPGAGRDAIRALSMTPSPTSAVSSSAVVAVRTATPSGPSLGSARVALRLVAQAAPEPVDPLA